jgi:predicted AlkP superfamily phosphohydrolase/phosphomutase
MRLLEYKSGSVIDYDRTVVFHNLWHLYFNESLLTREALAERGYDIPEGADVREWLVDLLRETRVRTDDGSKAFVINAEPIPRDSAGHVPDMVIQADYNEYMVAFWNIMNPSPQIVRELKGSERFWHQRDGVFLVWGDGVKPGFAAGTRNIQDIGPTILYLLGLPVAPDMDGTVLTDLFEPSITDGHPIVVNDGYRDIPREIVLPDDKRESLQKKMRSLGYIQ